MTEMTSSEKIALLIRQMSAGTDVQVLETLIGTPDHGGRDPQGLWVELDQALERLDRSNALLTTMLDDASQLSLEEHGAKLREWRGDITVEEIFQAVRILLGI